MTAESRDPTTLILSESTKSNIKYQVSIELSVHLLVYNSDDILVLHTTSCYILLPMHHLYMIRQTLLLATTVVAEPFNRVRGKMLDVRE